MVCMHEMTLKFMFSDAVCMCFFCLGMLLMGMQEPKRAGKFCRRCEMIHNANVYLRLRSSWMARSSQGWNG